MKDSLEESEYITLMAEIKGQLLFRQDMPERIVEDYRRDFQDEEKSKAYCVNQNREYVEGEWIKRTRATCIRNARIHLEWLVKKHDSFPIRHRENLKTALENNHPQWRGKFDSIIKTLGHGSIFILAGPRGTGKTELATGISRYFAEVKNQASCYAVLGDLFTRIKGTFKTDSTESEDGILTQLSKTPLLVLDECHEITGTEWQGRILTLLIDSRYRAKLDTIMITNHSQAGFIASVGESIVDRIAEVGYFIECDWQSFRRARL